MPNQDYLVPHGTAFLVYITVRLPVTGTAFTMETMICEAACDDPIRQTLKAASVYSGAFEVGGPWGRATSKHSRMRVTREESVEHSMPAAPCFRTSGS